MADILSKTNSLAMDLNNTRSSSDITSSRRECTRLLNQLKPVLRDISREDGRSLFISMDGNEFVNGSILSTLFAIIRNEDEISTEGHRETSVELLRGLVGGAFSSCFGLDDGDSNCIEQQNVEHTQALTVLFRQCATIFHQRMRRNTAISSDFHSNKGTLVEPKESSEHIRLLLVELLLDVSTFLVDSSNKSTNDKIILQSTSDACQSLGKSSLSDPYPEVQRASCTLIEALARLCPLAVRMHASLLLLPLAGDPESFTTLKSSLFRHRHTKTRCKAVDASAAIVLCCTKEVGTHDASTDKDTVYIECSISNDQGHHVGIVNHGNKSTSMVQLLHDSVLSSWEALIKVDSAASVREVVLRAAGKVSRVLEWNFSPSNNVEAQLDTKDRTIPSSTADLESAVETRLLLLLMVGISDSNVQVRALAVQQLNTLHKNRSSLPWDTITKYHQSMLELALEQCSSQKNLHCQSRVRSIEALQVLLSLGGTKSEDSKIFESNVQPIVDTLSNGILSDEKDVLEASLKACRVIGGINSLALNVLWHVFQLHQNQNTNNDTGTDEMTEETAAASNPRQLVSNILLLDGLMKGHLSNQEVASIFHEIDSSVPISGPDWFHQVYGAESSYVICQVLSSRQVLSNVTSNSTLAWALLDGVHSFVRCINQPLRIDSSPSANITAVCILTCITFLLGCPEEFDTSNNAMTILMELNSFDKLAHPALNDARSASLSLLDIYFRHIAMKINKMEPFPWKRSDPAFLAMDALLRNARGSTVRNNFDLVEPLFIHHLPLNADDVRDNEMVAADHDEQYSTRIWIMSLLQAVLSDATFSDGDSDQSTFDKLSAVLLVNLIWKSGVYAAALRKMSAAALFSLLHCCSNCIGGMEYETVKLLLPILQSNLDDSESSTREMSCLSLQLVLKNMSPTTFRELSDQLSNDTRVIDKIHTHLLTLLDDSHDPVRLAAIMTIETLLTIAVTSQNDSGDSCYLCHSALESITESLVLAMDDSQSDIQYHAFIVLSSFVKLVRQHDEIIGMVQRHVTNGQNTHRDREYCKSLLILCEKEPL